MQTKGIVDLDKEAEVKTGEKKHTPCGAAEENDPEVEDLKSTLCLCFLF